MGKTLKTAISQMDDNTVMFIGSKTNFFFIGTKEEFYRDAEEVEAYCNEFVRSAYTMAEDSWLGKIRVGYPKRSAYNSYDVWKEECKNYITRAYTAQKKMLDIKKVFKNYKPILKRAVLEEYERNIPDDPGHIIIISGIESGNYWFRNEYIRRNDGRELQDY